ncbi:MAG: septum formation initiator family protein [Acidimicrobiales bacterium]|jgi:cell division protein FtsB
MRLTVKFGLAVLVLCGAMYLFVFPARTYLAQKQDIVGQEQTIAVLKSENTKLAGESAALQNDSTIEQIARAKYGLVMPGQQAFMVLPSPAPSRPPAAPPRPKAPWYAPLEFWHHL